MSSHGSPPPRALWVMCAKPPPVFVWGLRKYWSSKLADFTLDTPVGRQCPISTSQCTANCVFVRGNTIVVCVLWLYGCYWYFTMKYERVWPQRSKSSRRVHCFELITSPLYKGSERMTGNRVIVLMRSVSHNKTCTTCYDKWRCSWQTIILVSHT